MDEVARLMREARIRAGWLQWKAAQRLNVSCICLSRYESGDRRVPRDVLVAAFELYQAPELLLTDPVGRAVAAMLQAA